MLNVLVAYLFNVGSFTNLQFTMHVNASHYQMYPGCGKKKKYHRSIYFRPCKKIEFTHYRASYNKIK